VLSGEDKGVKGKIINLISDLGIEKNVFIINRFTLNELKWIYLNSSLLVYPSFLGPTNMPIIEAYYLGCKIACSNLQGHFEQVGDFALYFSPNDPSEITKVILRELDSDKKLFPEYNHNIVFYNSFMKAINHIKSVRNTW
jgi:glycosyltransferase involved in cell wall biosynthesis